MSKLLLLILIILQILLSPLAVFAEHAGIANKHTYPASTIKSPCGLNYINFATYTARMLNSETAQIKVGFNKATLLPEKSYYINMRNDKWYGDLTRWSEDSDVYLPAQDKDYQTTSSNGVHEFTFTLPKPTNATGSFRIVLKARKTGGDEELCTIGSISVDDASLATVQCAIKMPPSIKRGDKPKIEVEISPKADINYKLFTFKSRDVNSISPGITLSFPHNKALGNVTIPNVAPGASNIQSVDFPGNTSNLDPKDDYTMVLRAEKVGLQNGGVYVCQKFPFKIDLHNETSAAISSGINKTFTSTADPNPIIPSAASSELCDPSSGVKGGGTGVLTAIGCVPTNPTDFINNFLKVAMGLSGGVALLLMVAGSYQMIMSAGNPEGVKKGQEQFKSAIIGLLFIIFSILLLQVIGVDILQIPGFRR